jgi:hypothetical protein
MANVGSLVGTTGSVAAFAFYKARAWYKGGDKSVNKSRYTDYLDLDPEEWPLELAGKIKRRIGDIELSDKMIDAVRQGPYNVEQSVAHGKLLRDNFITAGNCGEMSCVALSFAAEYGRRGNQLWMAALDDPADHQFALVGPAPPPLPRYRLPTISDLNHLTAGTTNHIDGLYVVDVWAGICCHASEYEMRFRAQMHKWSGQGKRVEYANEWRDPVAAGYLSVQLAATIALHPCLV